MVRLVPGGASITGIFRAHYPRTSPRNPYLGGMKIACAECGCVVDRGVRIIPCEDTECCCRDLPIREGEASSEHD